MRNLLLLTAISLAAWLAIRFWEAPAELFFLDEKARVQPLPAADSYMRGTETRKFDQGGQLTYVLRADTGLYYAGDDRFQLETPRLVAQTAGAEESPWRLTAKVAHIARRGEDVLLSGDVHAWQQAASGRNEFFTDDIRFSPGDNTASTEARVKLVQPEGTTTGKGMRADFDRQIYHLLADVRGYYNVR